jgi:hypothetical protein
MPYILFHLVVRRRRVRLAPVPERELAFDALYLWVLSLLCVSTARGKVARNGGDAGSGKTKNSRWLSTFPELQFHPHYPYPYLLDS